MLIKSFSFLFHSVSVLAFALFCSSCAALSLEYDAEAEGQLTLDVQTKNRAPAHAVHPGRMHVSMDHAAKTLTVEVTFDPCKPGGFVYEQNSLDVEINHEERSVTLNGVVNYVEQIQAGPTACEPPQKPIVFVSENAEPLPYLITNMSAWMGRGGNGIKARVKDFRTAEQMEIDHHNCLSKRETDIGNISGVWFLQSNPLQTMTLSGNASTITPEAIPRTWSGSYKPQWIKADQPYTFRLPSIGNTVFQSSSCALVFPPNSDKPSDILIRQTFDDTGTEKEEFVGD